MGKDRKSIPWGVPILVFLAVLFWCEINRRRLWYWTTEGFKEIGRSE